MDQRPLMNRLTDDKNRLKKTHPEVRVRLRYPRITRYCEAKPYRNPEMLGTPLLSYDNLRAPARHCMSGPVVVV